MINLQLPIAQNLPLPLPRDTGSLYRGLTHVLRSSFPFGLDPSHGLLHPGPDAAHTARRVSIPVGDHTAPGTFFVPKAATGATVCFVHGTSAFKVCPYYWFISRLLRAGIQVPEEDLKKYYSENKSRYATPEERRASHILVKADKNAPQDQRAKAKAKAESLLAEIKAKPSRFAELAKKNSDDPGSASRGGDLDYFGRGAMVKPFEDAAFSLKPGEISGLVESDFGYHVIQVTGARGGETRSFEQVRPEIEAEVRTQLAQKRFSEVAVDFTNMVYEQAESLKPAADKFKLEIRTARDVNRLPDPGATGPLANAKFLEALFAPDTIRNKRNTDAIETAPNQLVSGRMVEYAPARTLALAEVKDKVHQQVAAKQAAALAREEGEARVAQLKKEPAASFPGDRLIVSRAQPKDLPRQVIDALLAADTVTLPAVVGVDLGQAGYAVARVTRVLGRDPVGADTNRAQAQYAQAWGEAEAQAYYAALKRHMKVKVHEAAPAADAASAPAR